MKANTIYQFFGTTEQIKIVQSLKEIVLNSDKLRNMCDYFTNCEPDLTQDYFMEYFTENLADRKNMSQDFTPQCISQIVSEIGGKAENIADVCAGSGSLFVQAWNKNKDAFFSCYELSEAVLYFLLFNMSVRNVNGQVIQMDILSGETYACYKLTRTETYSDIEVVGNPMAVKNDLVVSNPPYSLKCKEYNVKYKDYPDPPNQFADYAFVYFGLGIMKETGKCVYVLSHGLLFRGNKEKDIRKRLIQQKLLNAVIGLPDKCFLITSIPIFLLVLENNSQNVLFIDASKECKKESKYNVITQQNIERMRHAYKGRFDIDKFSNIATVQEIEENDYNLNIPRYVDTYEHEPLPDIMKVADELLNINKEIKETESTLYGMMLQLVSSDAQRDAELKKIVETFGRIANENGINNGCIQPRAIKEREDIPRGIDNNMSFSRKQRGQKQTDTSKAGTGSGGKLRCRSAEEWEQLDLFTLCGMS